MVLKLYVEFDVICEDDLSFNPSIEIPHKRNFIRMINEQNYELSFVLFVCEHLLDLLSIVLINIICIFWHLDDQSPQIIRYIINEWVQFLQHEVIVLGEEVDN